MSADVFCYGEIGVDNIIQLPHLPNPELAAFPTADTYHIGGAAANTAVWLANFGIDTALSGNWIGLDLYGQQLWQWLNRHPHLDLSLVQRGEKETTPFCRAMVTPDGERTFLIYGYPQSRKTELAHHHLAGVTYLALDLYGGEERFRAAELASKAGVKTAVGDVIEENNPILPLAPIVTNSAAYMREALPGVEIRQQTRRLQALNKGIVVATDGAHEVFAVGAGGEAYRVRPPAVSAVDATGAGDAFRAGLLAGLLKGEQLPRALCLGAAAGALKVQHLGAATTLPSADEIVALADTLTAEAVS
jgi:sugar/nucleoside kinase (ribokinase family)